MVAMSYQVVEKRWVTRVRKRVTPEEARRYLGDLLYAVVPGLATFLFLVGVEQLRKR